MRHGSLFSGIGGFDLAAEWMGWENVFHCEWMPFPRKVLKYYWPDSISYENICTTDFTAHRGQIDILTGGFPCQPYSSAGKRLGKEDERHLWPEMLRAIREIEPTYIVGENVRGLTNWNGGVVFEEVCTDLESCGYEVQPILLPAASVGAPHRRDRIWFVAYSTRSSERADKFRGLRCENGKIETKRTQAIHDATRPNGDAWTSADTNSRGLERSKEVRRNCKYAIGESEFRAVTNADSNGLNQRNGNDEINPSEARLDALGNTQQMGEYNASNTESIRQEYALENRELERRRFRKPNQRNAWDSFPSQSPVCGGDDGLPTELDGISFSKWRQESIKGYGNAIVPQVAFQIFKVIEQLKQRQ